MLSRYLIRLFLALIADIGLSADRFWIFLRILVDIILQVRKKEFLELPKILQTNRKYLNKLKKLVFSKKKRLLPKLRQDLINEFLTNLCFFRFWRKNFKLGCCKKTTSFPFIFDFLQILYARETKLRNKTNRH